MLPPFQLVRTQQQWEQCLDRLTKEPIVAFDLEANSMFAYREEICLIQISIPGQDYIVDPLADIRFEPLGELFAKTAVEKVFHAAEYDLILLKRQFGWAVNNLFDTMWASRILGYQRYGLANMIEQLYSVKLDKRYQKSDWCKRPLTEAQLAYAQHDTHFLLRLRQQLRQELEEAGRLEEALETFEQQTAVKVSDNSFKPNDFWSINGAYDLSRQQQAILRELNIFRNHEAERRNKPLFKVFSDKTLLQMAIAAPIRQEDLHKIYGMSHRQVRRYGHHLLRVIGKGKNASPPAYPKRGKRKPEEVVIRYDKLHKWRKHRGLARGVESDVIISRDALWEIAFSHPQTIDELSELPTVGAWRCQTYGPEILAILHDE